MPSDLSSGNGNLTPHGATLVCSDKFCGAPLPTLHAIHLVYFDDFSLSLLLLWVDLISLFCNLLETIACLPQLALIASD